MLYSRLSHPLKSILNEELCLQVSWLCQPEHNLALHAYSPHRRPSLSVVIYVYFLRPKPHRITSYFLLRLIVDWVSLWHSKIQERLQFSNSGILKINFLQMCICFCAHSKIFSCWAKVIYACPFTLTYRTVNTVVLFVPLWKALTDQLPTNVCLLRCRLWTRKTICLGRSFTSLNHLVGCSAALPTLWPITHNPSCMHQNWPVQSVTKIWANKQVAAETQYLNTVVNGILLSICFQCFPVWNILKQWNPNTQWTRWNKKSSSFIICILHQAICILFSSLKKVDDIATLPLHTLNNQYSNQYTHTHT